MEGPEHVLAGPRECTDPRPGMEGLRHAAQDVAAGAGGGQDGGADRRRMGAESDQAERQGGQGQQAGRVQAGQAANGDRSEEHTSELQSLMRISYAVFCLKKKKKTYKTTTCRTKKRNNNNTNNNTQNYKP